MVEDNERNQMINDLNALGFEPILKNLLYGNERYSEETNKIAFSAFQEFIKRWRHCKYVSGCWSGVASDQALL